MTTVAFDGKTLAADTMAISGGLKRRTQKIFRLGDGRLFGGSGLYEEVLLVRDWLNDGGVKPKLEDFSGLVISNGKAFLLGQLLVLMPLDDKYAVGSGRDFAIAAMQLGKTAKESVEFAAQFDAWTGYEVETLET